MPRWVARRKGGFATAKVGMGADLKSGAAAGADAPVAMEPNLKAPAGAGTDAEISAFGDTFAFGAAAGTDAEVSMGADLTFRAITLVDDGVPYFVPFPLGGAPPIEGETTAAVSMSADLKAGAAAGADALIRMGAILTASTSQAGVPINVPFEI